MAIRRLRGTRMSGGCLMIELWWYYMRAAAIQTHSRSDGPRTQTHRSMCARKLKIELTLGCNTRKREVVPGIFGIGVCEMNVNYGYEQRPVCSDTWESRFICSRRNQISLCSLWTSMNRAIVEHFSFLWIVSRNAVSHKLYFLGHESDWIACERRNRSYLASQFLWVQLRKIDRAIQTDSTAAGTDWLTSSRYHDNS